MPAQFVPEPSGAPDRNIRIPEAERLAQRLAPLLLKGSAPILEFSRICQVGSVYERYDGVLQAVIRTSRRFTEVAEFFQALYDEYVNYASTTLREIWVNAVAYIVEHTFVILTKSKYPDSRMKFYPEHKVFIPAPPKQISTGNYPIDVIAWCEESFCGEFLEVKKNIDTYEGNLKFYDKVEVMYTLAHDLQYHSPTPSVVGIATLSESPRAERMVKSILVTLGSMLDDEELVDVNPRFHVINIKNLTAWYARRIV